MKSRVVRTVTAGVVTAGVEIGVGGDGVRQVVGHRLAGCAGGGKQLVEAPLAEHRQGGPECPAAVGQGVLDAFADGPGDPLDEVTGLQAAEPVAEHVGADAG